MCSLNNFRSSLYGLHRLVIIDFSLLILAQTYGVTGPEDIQSCSNKFDQTNIIRIDLDTSVICLKNYQ